ncbi:Choriogenin Hminor [Teratosphaeria destructans]|uniref:Choriogenin Hminor n=1 Tax=Teratosphaeria destructans TaxID=418781 RepID=A0A9W7SRS5_9PEZI|nr:Choriogenin Hminor [Teratosphaeria destructans]
MAKRLSSFMTAGMGPDASAKMSPDSASSSPREARRQPPVETMPRLRSRSPAARLLRKAPPSQPQTRATSGPFLTPQPSLYDLQSDPTFSLAPPPYIAADLYSTPLSRSGDSRPASRAEDRSRPGTPNFSRPATPQLIIPGQPPTTSLPTGDSAAAEKSARRKSLGWFGKSKDEKHTENRGPVAWIAGHPQKLPYDTGDLLAARPLQEMWDDSDGNCFVYLYPRIAGKGASLKVDSAIFASSPALTKLAFGDLYSSDPYADRRDAQLNQRAQQFSLSTPPDTPRHSDNSSSGSIVSRDHFSNFSDGASEAHLYLPIKLNSDNPGLPTPRSSKSSKGDFENDPSGDDLQTLVDVRNFFAFLCGQALVATERKPSFFQIFLSIASLLKTYEFSNLDGSTFGEVASSSFDAYVEELGLADVRTSREKTIEGVVLAERMKSIALYNEAFTHAAGKFDDLVHMKSPKFNLISPITQNRLTRAAMDLEKRLQSVQLILKDFDFPSLFNGIMNSKMSVERKEGVRFDEWKDAWWGMRKWTMHTLAQRYGHWPPKASSKKNDLETSGLNRLVLLDLYRDMSSLYDLLADRTNLTSRTVDSIGEEGAREEPSVRALRAVLSEYDRSTLPVKPPIPFDLPRLPDLRTVRPDAVTGDKDKDAKLSAKKLKDDAIGKILRASWNDDTVVTPFIDAYRDMERRAAHGCNINQIVDLRIGQWIFMYVVLQALPMLACDAPGIMHTKGVECFLCEPPRSGVPWANSNAISGAGAVKRTWFSVGDGGGVVSLPSDVVEHGVEGIYRRSHCWVKAEEWSANNPMLNSALHEQEAINAAQSAGLGDGMLPPPNGLMDGVRRDSSSSTNLLGAPMSSRSGSPASHRLSTFGLGLEALPLPVGVNPDGRAASPAPGRPQVAHSVDASKTFDAILASTGQQQKSEKSSRWKKK